jgi:hypothetical protein
MTPPPNGTPPMSTITYDELYESGKILKQWGEAWMELCEWQDKEAAFEYEPNSTVETLRALINNVRTQVEPMPLNPGGC